MIYSMSRFVYGFFSKLGLKVTILLSFPYYLFILFSASLIFVPINHPIFMH